MPSVTTCNPPASSIFMSIEVPERGRPETTMTGAPKRIRRYRRTIDDMVEVPRRVPSRRVRLGRLHRIDWRAFGGLARVMRASRASIQAWGAAALLLAAVAPPAEAYIGPGAGFALLSSFFVVFTTIILAALSLLTWPIRMA